VTFALSLRAILRDPLGYDTTFLFVDRLALFELLLPTLNPVALVRPKATVGFGWHLTDDALVRFRIETHNRAVYDYVALPWSWSGVHARTALRIGKEFFGGTPAEFPPSILLFTSLFRGLTFVRALELVIARRFLQEFVHRRDGIKRGRVISPNDSLVAPAKVAGLQSDARLSVWIH